MTNNLVIIMVSYNGFYLTKACLESIRENEKSVPFIVLVDNNSNDPDLLDSLKEIYTELKIIKNEVNIGFGKANNIGIQWAIENIDFNYLALLNNDTTITKNALSSLLSDFKNDEIGIVTSRIMYEDQKDLVWFGGANINFNYGEPQMVDMRQEPSEKGALLSRNIEFASGCLMVFTKKSLEKLKGFDERFFMYAEDLELSIRCKKEGFKIWYNAEVVIYHKVQGSFGKASLFKGMHPKNSNIEFQFYERKVNQWLTFRKHLHGLKFLKFSFFYWMKYKLLLLKLLVLSPKRFGVLRAHFKLINTLLFHRNNKINS